MYNTENNISHSVPNGWTIVEPVSLERFVLSIVISQINWILSWVVTIVHYIPFVLIIVCFMSFQLYVFQFYFCLNNDDQELTLAPLRRGNDFTHLDTINKDNTVVWFVYIGGIPCNDNTVIIIFWCSKCLTWRSF
jgi:hypothetical protein